MSWTRTLSRRLLPVVGLATLAFGVVAGGLAWRRHAARARALEILDRGPLSLNSIRELESEATRALEVFPGLEEAEAALAVVAAWRGDLPRAHALSPEGGSPWALRARAWLAFREGSPERARTLLEATPFVEDGEWIAFASGAPISSTSTLAGTLRKFEGDSGTIRSGLREDLSSNAGSDLAQLARRLLARIETIELHDEAADALLHEADLQPQPFDRSVAALARAEVAAIRSGSDVGVEPWKNSTDGFRLGNAIAILDRALANRALARARHELELFQLFGRAGDRQHALARTRRALALPVGDKDHAALFLEAWARACEPPADDAPTRELAERVRHAGVGVGGPCESARLLLALGDEPAARAAFDDVRFFIGNAIHVDNMIYDEFEELWAAPTTEGGPRFWFSKGSSPVCSKADEASATAALRSFALGHPWEAKAFLDRCENVRPECMAFATARTDPVRALALWAHKRVDSDDWTLRAFAAFLDDTPAVLAGKLQAAGLSGNRAQETAGAIDTVRSELKRDGFLEDDAPAPAASSSAR